MPTTFDFIETGAGWNSTITSKPFALTQVADGVKFTVSSPQDPNLAFVGFGNTAASNSAFLISAGTSSLSFTLKLEDNTNAALNQFSGTTANKVVLDLGKGTGSFFSRTWKVEFLNGTGVVHQFSGVSKNADLSVTGQFTAIRFSNSLPGLISIKSLTVNNLNCFCAGTLIDTPDGKRAVETLQAGDILRTADGRETTVKWVGQQAVDTQLTHPKMVNPICVTKGALGPDLPERDLFLSQDHAIAIDGTLYNAGTLVNGDTIYQVADMPLDGFTYYHVETEVHELLLAEGLAAESFIDYAGRDGFDNGAEREGASMIAEMDMPRVSSARMVPAHLKPRKAA